MNVVGISAGRRCGQLIGNLKVILTCCKQPVSLVDEFDRFFLPGSGCIAAKTEAGQ